MDHLNTTLAPPLAPAITPELSLLLTIARVDLSRSEQALLQHQLAGPLDWEHLLALADRHGLEPLLYRHLYRTVTAAVPHDVIQVLRQESSAIAQRSLILAAKLQGISAHLRARNIEHISYKGPLLAEDCYGSCALRLSNDLDLIVPQHRLAATRDALLEIGFADQNGLTHTQQAVSFRFGFQHPFTAARGVDLDLHWRVVQTFKARALDMKGMWKRATTTRLFDADVPTFSPEDNLVALCLHAGHHGWMQLSHFCDIAQLLRTYPTLNWGIVLNHMGDSNTRRILHVCWHLLKRHWNAEIPEAMMAHAGADPHVAHLAQRVETEIWPTLEPALTTANLRWLMDRSAGEDPVDRLHLLAGSVFWPAIEDIALFRLPPLLTPFYGVLRALRLAFKGAAS